MAAVHVVRIELSTIDANGNRISKTDPSVTINQMKNSSMDARIIPDTNIASSTGWPTIKTYLEREAALGFYLRHLDQSFVITYDSA